MEEMTTTILSKAGFMKPDAFCADSQNSRADRIAPSVRVPVTVANRAYLKFLRRAELEAWRDARGGTVCARRSMD